MRKKLYVVALFAVLLLCTACQDDTASHEIVPSASSNVTEVLEQGKTEVEAEVETPEPAPNSGIPEPTLPSKPIIPASTTSEIDPDNVDLDLTSLSATMVYSNVFLMMSSPEEYEGKSIKMTGTMSIYTAPSTGVTYYAVIIQDATACCSQGIEFVLADDIPENYPKDGTQITVVGAYQTYEDLGGMYCHLVNALLVES